MNEYDLDLDAWLDENYDDETEALGIDNDEGQDYNDESEGTDYES